MQISLRISTFVVRCLDSIIPLVSISEISSPYLVTVAEQAGLSLPRRKPQRQVFLRRGSYKTTEHQNLFLREAIYKLFEIIYVYSDLYFFSIALKASRKKRKKSSVLNWYLMSDATIDHESYFVSILTCLSDRQYTPVLHPVNTCGETWHRW